MLTYSTIAAGTPTDAQAMTNHLLTQTLPREVADLARYYTRGMTAGSAEDHDVAEEAGPGERLAQAVQRREFDETYGAPVAEPRRDMHPLVVRGLGLDPDRGATRDEINALLSGRRADGGKIEGKHYAVARTVTDRRSGEAKDLVPIGSVDFCLTPDKSVSVAWAFAQPAEQAAIYGAHRDAAAEAMAYVETRIGQARKGDGGREGADQGHVGWIAFDHHTSRPTLWTTRQENGRTVTESVAVKIAGDPDLHTHFTVMNAVFCENGRLARPWRPAAGRITLAAGCATSGGDCRGGDPADNAVR